MVGQDLVSNKQTTSWNHNSRDTLQVVVVTDAITCGGNAVPSAKTRPGGDRQYDDAAMTQPVNVLTRALVDQGRDVRRCDELVDEARRTGSSGSASKAVA
jgi:hypothetical protein